MEKANNVEIKQILLELKNIVFDKQKVDQKITIL